MENLNIPNCIRTVSGIYIDVFNQDPDEIDIEDIAHALSMQPRFWGNLYAFYSVAAHSLNCMSLVSDEYKLAGLLHDASEAYLLDIHRPIKHRIANYREIEDRLMYCIAGKYRFVYPFHPDIKQADNSMLQV
jgi:hypothetical protein